MARKEIGVHNNGDSWSVVFPSRETRDGYRSISFPLEAEAVLRGHYCPPAAASNPPRKQAIIDALRKRTDGMSLGSLVNSALEAVGEDSEDMVLRKRMCGLINTLVDECVLLRAKDGVVERFTLAK